MGDELTPKIWKVPGDSAYLRWPVFKGGSV